ncbi:hypothetical protein PC129_g6928 [Phytophthora cactorum]|uniref:Uncharacterized protein n=1 Tax=Phytophthora cactorum TaxID=29920 RepID=A0A8T1KDK4_9STRA|nr:hypothetical protein Pcac1_g5904 [Phytophthora cactorum]KAG2816658.1 hypothetical protein PC111_g13047 [Phytophthora cactorum]KAG2817343.1 hypothetical protein PC112_g13093 [Phytophthora cactorum]KAG2853240.1 hypothetical protein PC113_g14324 [Phytophthora cactorum]KAG2896040.1 hypothetical protein PC114_g15263 [Phytophthora cactorum]
MLQPLRRGQERGNGLLAIAFCCNAMPLSAAAVGVGGTSIGRKGAENGDTVF